MKYIFKNVDNITHRRTRIIQFLFLKISADSSRCNHSLYCGHNSQGKHEERLAQHVEERERDEHRLSIERILFRSTAESKRCKRQQGHDERRGTPKEVLRAFDVLERTKMTELLLADGVHTLQEVPLPSVEL